MRTDRELLELAAQAAGYDVIWNENWQCFQHCNPVPDKFGGQRFPWTPDTDDGDALRLAVKLEIRASVSGMKAGADWWRRPAMTELDCEIIAIDGDPYAALRRAIVCAAAEIATEMAEVLASRSRVQGGNTNTNSAIKDTGE